MAHLTIRQIKQLIEIDEAGPGIRAEVQALITRLTSGGVGVKTDDPRQAQAKRLWDKGFGREQGFDMFDAYLATIPVVPEAFKADERFPELVLVDARLPITKACELLGVDFSGDNQTYVDFDPKQAKSNKVYWILCQDGRKNYGKSVKSCRQSFAADEVGLSAYQGLAIFAQNPEGLKGRAMDLPGSVRRDGRDDAAFLVCFFDRPRLSWCFDDDEDPVYGTGSRRE